jgi:hypothetical protein
MTLLSSEYQREAAYAMEMADKAPTDDLRAHWLRLARKWLDMLPQDEKQARNAFDSSRRDTGTREENSPVSNRSACG